jgi:hypothetical protein
MLHNTICGFGSLTRWLWKKYEPTVPEDFSETTTKGLMTSNNMKQT